MSKKCLRSHITRIHTSKHINKPLIKKTTTTNVLSIQHTNSSPCITPGRSAPMVVKPSLEKSQSPNYKRARIEESESGEDSDMIIADIVKKIVDTSAYSKNVNAQTETNYQCGACVKIFATEEETEKRM